MMTERDYQKICALCENAQKLCGEGALYLCPRRGVVAADFHCNKFSFDPLKRIPLPRPAFRGLEEGEEEPREELGLLLSDTDEEEEELRRADPSLHFVPLGKENL